MVAAPSVVRAQGGTDVDVAIIGAGAAGISAARRIAAANRRFVLLEASRSDWRTLRYRFRHLSASHLTSARTGSIGLTAV